MMNFQSARAARGSGSILAFVKSRGGGLGFVWNFAALRAPFPGDEPAGG